jgi:putative pre-16S rRNA nuclease
MNPILALDFGRARIGAAISDELQLLAHPLETIPANEQALSRVAEIVREKKVDHVVAGLPKQMDGQLGSAATEVLQFVEKLRAILPCPVVTWDERLTTVAAPCASRAARRRQEDAADPGLRRSSCGSNDLAKLSRQPRAEGGKGK